MACVSRSRIEDRRSKNRLESPISDLRSIFIVGPTASGKSALSIELAKKLNAEIICADSQTVRRDMNIGTAKPTAEDRALVPHHLLDVVGPYESYSLAQFLDRARAIVREIQNRGMSVIVVGGTGLYIDALYFNFELPSISTDINYEDMSNEKLQQLVIAKGFGMPANKENKRHLINTIKRSGQTGLRSSPTPGSYLIGINPERGELVRRINLRVDAMFEAGFLDEVREIITKYGEPPRPFDAIGYRIAHRYIKGEISEKEARELFKIADRQYAKRQMSWYKRNPDIQWFRSPDEAKTFILGNT